MAENTEKKVLISVEVLDNFIAAKKNIDFWKKSLKEAEQSGTATKEQLRDIATNLAKASNEFKAAKTNLEASSKAQDIFNTVGEKANRTIGDMQRELKALRNVPFDNLSPEEIAKVEQSMADLAAEIDDYKTKIKGLDTGEFAQNVTGVAEAGSALLQVTGQVSGALGIENETFKKLQDSTVELIGATQALGVITEFLDKKKLSLVKANIATMASNLKETISTKLNTLAKNQQTVGENASTFAKVKGAIATKLITAATWLWNAALAQNPVVLIAIAIVGLVAILYVLAKAFSNASKEQEAATKSSAAYKRQAQKTQNTIDIIEAKRTKQVNESELNGRKELDQLKRNGATKEQLANKEYDIATRTRNIQIKYSADIVKAKSEEFKSLDKNLTAQKNLLATYDKGSDKYNEQVGVINDLIAKKKELAGVINEEINNGKKLVQDQTEAETQAQLERTQKAKEASDKRKAIAEKNAKAEIEIENIKSQTIIEKQNAIANNEKKSFNDRKAALEKSESEQIKIIERNRDLELKNKELTELERKSITEKAAFDIAKIKSDVDKSITDIDAKEIDKRLKLEADALEVKKQQLANKQALDLEDLSKEYANSLKKAKYASDVVAINERYEKDKLAIAQKYREQDFNESITALKAQLDLLPADAIARIEIEKAIADAKATYAKESADIAIKANEDIASSHEESVKKQLELEQQLKDKKAELFSQLQTTIQDITNGVFERKNIELDAETAKISEQYDNQIAAAEGNDKKQKALEQRKAIRLEEQEKQKRKLARDQAIAERLFAAFSVGLSTTKAVMGALAPPPVGLGPVAGIPLAITIGATGALQLASVMASPLPKAAKGKVFKGNSHAQGGIPVEVEGDEMILTKGVYRNPVLREIASMINQAGGGVSLAAGTNNTYMATGGVLSNAMFKNDGGYVYRNYSDSGLTEDKIERAMEKAVAKIKVLATIEDIRKADENYTIIEDRGSY